jgi:predicted ester cyclase
MLFDERFPARRGAAAIVARAVVLGSVVGCAVLAFQGHSVAVAADAAAGRKPVISCAGNEKNLATYLQMHKVLFTDRDGARVEEFYAPEIISHNTDSGGTGARKVPSSFMANMWNNSRQKDPGRVLDDELILCSGDYVIVRTLMRARDNAGMPPNPPTGKPYEISATDIYRFENGRVVERWGNSDLVSAYRQIGYTFVPPPAAPAQPPAAQGLPINMPAKPFGELPAPPAPDYANLRFWAALPDRLDAADVVPENDSFGDRQASAGVDVFYIHPTTYRGAENWNQPLDDAATNAWTDESVVARQAAVFNACCRVFAPRYRQATAAAVGAPPAMRSLEAYELAWQDVRTAFLHYMKHWNGGRPFIIAGHSQGASHIERWFRDFGANQQYRGQLVAAYAIGIPFAERTLRELGGGVPVCATPDATGCLVSWNAFDRAGDPTMYLAGAAGRYRQRYGTDAGSAVACVNPLTFSLSEGAATSARNLGSLPARRGVGLADTLARGVRLPATEPGRIGAACEGGVLRVEGVPKDGYAIVPLPNGLLHFNEFDLFYQNIRANAVARSAAFRKR